MEKNSLLIINDVTGYGRVSTFAMLPVLAKQGIHAYVLPTALVSNTMDYGSAEILDTTDFMKKSINKWHQFGFSFDNIITGLINSEEQADIIINLIENQNHPFVVVDPIMADDGKLYPDMYPGAIECNRKLASIADVIIPNVTEATMLIDEFVGRTVFKEDEYEYIIDRLKGIGAKNIVITGCASIDGNKFNLVYDNNNKSIYKVEFDNIPRSYIGTGDVFSASLTANLIKGTSLVEAVQQASSLVSRVAVNNLSNEDPFDLLIEPYI